MANQSILVSMTVDMLDWHVKHIKFAQDASEKKTGSISGSVRLSNKWLQALYLLDLKIEFFSNTPKNTPRKTN